MNLNLNLNPQQIVWPKSHYIFIQKIGDFSKNAPAAWHELHQKLNLEQLEVKPISFTSLYQVQPQMLYRAGVMLENKPKSIPTDFAYELFVGGNYLKFVLKGSYSQLPEACGKVFAKIENEKIKLRKGFFIENYANDPKTTPEAELITEILVPV